MKKLFDLEMFEGSTIAGEVEHVGAACQGVNAQLGKHQETFQGIQDAKD